MTGTNSRGGDDHPAVDHRTGSRRALTVVAVLLAAALAGAIVAPAAAWAHSRLEASTPAASARVGAPVAEVTLTFNEHVHQQFSIVEVDGPGGVSYSKGHVTVVDNVVHQAVYPLRSGGYTVRWRVVSADTHPVQGQFAFTTALPANEEPTAGPPTGGPSRSAAATGGSAPLWPWLLGALAVVVILIVVLRLVRRRPGGRAGAGAGDGPADAGEDVGDDETAGGTPA